MAKVKMVAGEWGSLATDTQLTKEQIETKARGLLGQMSLDEKIHQMSGDTPLLSGGYEMMYTYNARPIPAGENRKHRHADPD